LLAEELLSYCALSTSNSLLKGKINEKNRKYQTVRTDTNCNQNIVETDVKSMPLTLIYITAPIPGMEFLFMFELEIRFNQN